MQAQTLGSRESGGLPLPSPSSSIIHVNGTSALRGNSSAVVAVGDHANINGSEVIQSGAKRKKKERKKGWKGWALVFEDDQGNLIDEKDGSDSPQKLSDPASHTSTGECMPWVAAKVHGDLRSETTFDDKCRGFHRCLERSSRC